MSQNESTKQQLKVILIEETVKGLQFSLYDKNYIYIFHVDGLVLPDGLKSWRCDIDLDGIRQSIDFTK